VFNAALACVFSDMANLHDIFPAFSCATFMLSIPGDVFWPYCSGIAILFLGLATAAISELSTARGIQKLVLLGPVWFAFAMAVFGADHLTAAKFVAMIVPSWMPAKLFWTYFVGIALIAAAVSLVTKIQLQLSTLLLGIMIFLFVLMIHVPNWLKAPGTNVSLTILLRDTSLSAGALAFALSQTARKARNDAQAKLGGFARQGINACRFAIAATLVVFGIDQCLDPTFAPGIPQENPAVIVAMPAWIPAHAFWPRLTGLVFLGCGLAIMMRKHARVAANVVGVTVLLMILFVYIPLTIAKAGDIANGLNYLAIHFALAGSAFLLSSAVATTPSAGTEMALSQGAAEEPIRRVN
jgi:uncharacterized membrane protein